MLSSETGMSADWVSQSLSRPADIPVDGEPLTAFVGPAPRGPVDRAVPVATAADFETQFGVPGFHCRMSLAVRQFFANGGRNARVVRVSGTARCGRIDLPGAAGALRLRARNPGTLEFLRASVDCDGVDADDTETFNLIVQRLRTSGSAWIDEQEYFRRVSVRADSRDYVGKVLTQSNLVTLEEPAPPERPALTIKTGSLRESGYVDLQPVEMASPAVTDYDLVGSAAAGTGLNALQSLDDIAHVCLISGAKDASIGPVALLAAERFCRQRQALLILDPPARWRSVHDVVSDQQRSGFASPNAVTWFPCARVRNAAGDCVLASATGAVAAALTMAGSARDVPRLHATALVMQRGDLRLDADLDSSAVQRLARVGVNALAQRSALHHELHGVVTQASHARVVDGLRQLDQRRDVLFVLRRLRLGTRWLARNDSGARQWRELRSQVMSFLAALQALGVLYGDHPEEAGFVRCDTDTQRALPAGSTGFLIGFRPAARAGLLTFRIVQSGSGCRIRELGTARELARTG